MLNFTSFHETEDNETQSSESETTTNGAHSRSQKPSGCSVSMEQSTGLTYTYAEQLLQCGDEVPVSRVGSPVNPLRRHSSSSKVLSVQTREDCEILLRPSHVDWSSAFLGEASQHDLELFVCLPGLIRLLFSMTRKDLAQNRCFILLLLFEIQNTISTTLEDKRFASRFTDPHAVKDFITMWGSCKAALERIGVEQQTSPDSMDVLRKAEQPMVALATDFLDEWLGMRDNCYNRVVARKLEALTYGQQASDSRINLLIGTGTVLQAVASLHALAVAFFLGNEVTDLVPLLVLATLSFILTFVVIGVQRYLTAGSMMLALLSSVSPLVLHGLPKHASLGDFPLGAVFLPPWFTSLHTTPPPFRNLTAVLYPLCFAIEAILLARGFESVESHLNWLPALSLSLVAATFLLLYVVDKAGMKPLLCMASLATRLPYYQQLTLAALGKREGRETFDSEDTVEDQERKLRANTLEDPRDKATWLLGNGVGFHVGPPVPDADRCSQDSILHMARSMTDKRFPKTSFQNNSNDMRTSSNGTLNAANDLSTSQHSAARSVRVLDRPQSPPEVKQADDIAIVTNGQPRPPSPPRSVEETSKTFVATLEDPSPFGELVFPNPLSSESCLIRINAREVHQHLLIILITADTNEVVYWNSCTASTLDIPARVAIGHCIMDFVHNEGEIKILSQFIQQAREQARNDWGSAAAEQTTAKHLFHLQCSDEINQAPVELCVAGSFSDEYLMIMGSPSRGVVTNFEPAKWTLAAAHLQELFNLIKEIEEKVEAKTSLMHKVKKCRNTIIKLHGLTTRRLGVMVGEGFTTLDVRLVVQKLEKELAPLAAEQGVHLVLSPMPPDVPQYIVSHPVKLPQTLGYLISNGIRFTPKGGTVTLSLSIFAQSTARMLRFTVLDTGPSIPVRIVKAVNKATSLNEAKHARGLVSTNLVVHELGGSMSIEPRVEQPGTEASIYLPLLQEEQGTQQANTLVDLPVACQVPMRCLLVVTNPIYRSNLSHYLWYRNHSVTIATDMSRIQGALDCTDLVVIDVEAEGIAVEALLESLKHREIQVLLASRGLTEQQMEVIKEAGWHGVSFPLRGTSLVPILHKIEEEVEKIYQQKKQIMDIRKAFEGNANAPWERGQCLGVGSFGKVVEATNTLTGGKMACKIIQLGEGEDNQANLNNIFSEIQVMAQLEHPNIIHYFYCERGEDELYIFMELADGSLTKVIPKNGMHASQASMYLEGILLGLQHLHSKGIVHRDIKPGNVLLSRGTCKLTDFGTAVQMKTGGPGKKDTEQITEAAGTPHYMAPEVLNEVGHDWRADIWSVGCLLMEMVTGKPPWSHIGQNSWATVKYVANLPTSGEPADLGPYKYDQYVLEFFRATIVVDVDRRVPCNLLLETSLLTDMNDNMRRKSSVFFLASQSKPRAAQRGKPAMPRAKKVVASSPADSGKYQKPRLKIKGQGRKESYAAGTPPVPNQMSPDREDEDLRRGTAFSGWGIDDDLDELEEVEQTQTTTRIDSDIPSPEEEDRRGGLAAQTPKREGIESPKSSVSSWG